MTLAGIRAIAVAGLGIAGYLSVLRIVGADPICTASHGCEVVQSSSYAELAGVPVAFLGLLGYAAILALTFATGELGILGPAGLAIAGAAFSGYLQYRSLVTLEATCIWCVASAVCMALLAALTTIRAVRTA